MEPAARLIIGEREIAIGPRTAGIVEELAARETAIEKARKGRVEITIDFANGFMTVAVREIGESKPLKGS